MPSDIQAVVFDIGRVLVDFTFEHFAAFLSEHGAAISTTEEFIEKTNLHAYERGELSSAEFIGRINKLLQTPVSEDELKERWKRIFRPVPKMLDLAEGLQSKYRVYLLSNTSELHWEYLSSEYRLHQRFGGAVTSFETGALKPDPKIFQQAEKTFSLLPEQTIFVDDLAQNAAGATSRGWHGVHHSHPESTKEALLKLGVQS